MATKSRAKAPVAAVGRGLNLNAARQERARAHAARRGAKLSDPVTLPVIFGDSDAVIAELGPELPLDVFEPLLDAIEEIDLPALIIQVIEALNGEDKDERDATLEAVVAVMVTSPNLPRAFVGAVQQIGRNLLGDDGYAAFVTARPTPQDVGALVGGLLDWYGVASLGESLRSSSSSKPDGGTSKPTSPTTTTGSGSPESGGDQESPDSSAPAA